jgi:hypothetical protein
MKVAVERYF